MLGVFENSKMNKSQYLILDKLQSSWESKAKYANSQASRPEILQGSSH